MLAEKPSRRQTILFALDGNEDDDNFYDAVQEENDDAVEDTEPDLVEDDGLDERVDEKHCSTTDAHVVDQDTGKLSTLSENSR